MLGRPIISRDMLTAHRVGVTGQSDIIWAPLYDFQAFPSAGSSALSFFTAGIGSGTSSAPKAGAVAKTRFDTNLNNPGQLTKGNEFYMVGSETLFFPGVNNDTTTPFGINPGRGSVALANVGQFINDMWQVGNTGLKTLQIGTDRTYIQDGPLSMFPPVSRLALQAALSTTNDSDSTAASVVEEVSYASWGGEPYSIVPIYLESNQSFTLGITFAATIALPSTQIARIGERLRGYLIRQAT